MSHRKKVKLDLTSIDSNAFSLMGAFSGQAKREGWTPDEIKAVIDTAQTEDYNFLVQTLMTHCE